MTTVVGNKILKNLGTTQTTLLETTANNRFTVIGLSFTNVSDSIVYVDATLDDGYYMKDVMLPVGSSLRAINSGEKLTMGFNSNFKVSASANNSIDVIASFASIVEQGLDTEVQLLEGEGIRIVRNGNKIRVGVVPQDLHIGVAADDSSVKDIKIGETLELRGTQNISTASDAEGRITFTGPDLTSYVQSTDVAWQISADNDTYRNIIVGNRIKVSGTQNVSTTSDAVGNIVIAGPDLSNYVQNTATAFSITTDDTTTDPVLINETIQIKGGNNITTSNDGSGGIVISGPANLLNIGADDLQYKQLSIGANFAIKGGTNVTTTSDANGNITINGADLTSYVQNTDVAWRKGDQAGTYQDVTVNNTVQFRGYNGITVSHITNGIGITGPSVLWRIAADDDQYKTVGVNQNIKLIGGSGITTTSDASGNITITAGGGAITLGSLANVTTTNPQNNDILVYNNNQWVNTPNTAGDLDPIVAAIALG